MVFVPPTWFEGLLFYASWTIVPLIIAVILFVVSWISDSKHKDTATIISFGVAILFVAIAICGAGFLADWSWHYSVEEQSVQEKVITVDDWQPYFGHYWGDVQSADDLMLKTTDGELFANQENFLFGKFNTRDILDQVKPNGTYKIKYYGWREGYNNGIPNILSVEQVIDEKNTPSHHDISNYMNKRSVIIDDGNSL